MIFELDLCFFRLRTYQRGYLLTSNMKHNLKFQILKISWPELQGTNIILDSALSFKSSKLFSLRLYGPEQPIPKHVPNGRR